MRKFLLIAAGILSVVVSARADTGVTLYDVGTTNYMQIHSPTPMGSSYRMNMPLKPGTTSQVLAIMGISGNVINTSFTTPTGGGGGGSPGGNLNDVQFNAGGSSFGGSDSLTWNGTTFTVTTDFLAPATSSITIKGTLIANGSAGNVGQVLASNGPGAAPTFIDPIVSQSTGALLNATVAINPSSNTVYVQNMQSATTVYVVNPTTVTFNGITQPVQVLTSTLQVQIAGTVPISGTFFQTVQPVNQSGTFTITPGTGTLAGAIQIVNVSGSTQTVGYQGTTISSVPVNVLNSVTVNALPTGTNNIGTVTNSSVTVMPPVGTNFPVTISNNPSTFPGALQMVNVSGSTQSVSYQGLNISSIPVNVVNTVSISGAITSNSVNITTAPYGGAITPVGVAIGGVGPTGLFQAFSVTASSALNISGTINATSVNVTTVTYDTTLPTVGSALAFVNPTGLAQSPRVDASSNIVTTFGGTTQPVQVLTSTLQVQVAGTVPVSGTFFQGTQPISATAASFTGTVTPGTGTWTTSGNPLLNTITVTAGTGTWPVTGTFFQATQPVSVATPYQVFTSSFGVNGSTMAVSVLGTVPVSGTFFQATQPVSIAGAIQLASSTIKVDGSGVTQPVSGSVTALQGPLAYNIVSTNTLNVSGSFSATSVSNSTSAPDSPLPVAATLVGGVSPTNTMQAFRVDASSNLFVNIAAGAGSGGTSSNYSSIFPVAGTAAGFVSPNGTMQAPRVDASSDTIVIGTLSDNGQAAATNRVGTTPGEYQTDYANGVAGTQGRDSAQDHGTDGLLWTAALPSFRPASYTASTGTITSAATATDIAAKCGDATNTVVLYGVRIACTQTTAGIVSVNLIKRSTGYTGVFSTMTPVSDDSTYGLSVSSAIWFLANPTVGTFAGNLDSAKLGCMATGTTSPNDIYMSPPDWRMKPIILRQANDCVAVNLNSTTITGGSFSVGFSYIETKSITP